MVKNYNKYLKENCGCIGNEASVEIAPIELFSKIANSLPTKQDTCPSCSKFPEDCGCRGNCGNCGDENGNCDCSINQDISIGDMVRNVNQSCPQFKSVGRVVDMPNNNSVTFTVVRPGGDSSIGQLLNATRDQITVDEKYRI